jgi:hypothetical protein
LGTLAAVNPDPHDPGSIDRWDLHKPCAASHCSQNLFVHWLFGSFLMRRGT